MHNYTFGFRAFLLPSVVLYRTVYVGEYKLSKFRAYCVFALSLVGLE